MRDGTDFASYMVARWPALVRTLVLLGSTPDQAETDVVEGLARGRSTFDRARREGDVDAWVYRLVLDARGRSAGPASFDVPGVVDPTITDLEDRVAQLEQLKLTLAALAPEEREAVVLRFVAELDTGQVADVLGVSVDVVEARLSDTVPPPYVFREASEAIALRVAPVDLVRDRARQRRRRAVRWTAGGLAALLAVVAISTWLGTRPDDPGLPDPVVTEAVNPANVAWYANRLLHLAQVTVELPQVEEMVEVPEGVVYADREGRVVLVDGDGVLTSLGRTDPGVPIAGSGDRGWVSWRDADGEPALIVFDTIGRREVARLPVDPGALPIAVDQDKVYFSQGDQSYAWTAGQKEPGSEARDGLLDVSSAVRVTRFSDSLIMITQPLFDIELTVPGTGAQVSPDGDYVMTRVDFDFPDETRIYSAATGNQVDLDVSDLDVAVAAGFGPDDTVTFVLARREHSPDGEEYMRLSNSGPLTLRTCDLDVGTCEAVTQFANNRGVPVMPH